MGTFDRRAHLTVPVAHRLPRAVGLQASPGGRAFILWYVRPWYAPVMKVDKLSVSFDPDLGDAVRAAAQRSGRGLSGWLAEAAAARLRAEALAEFLDAWEAEHGELTAEELARATAEIGLSHEPRMVPAA